MSTATPSHREEIRSRRGHVLGGLAVRPAGTQTAPWALISHCFTCGKDLKVYHTLCRNLAAEGWASLRFDFTGLGKSGGEFGDTDLDSNVADLEDAAAHLDEFYAPPRLLVGHSLGGAAALLAAPRLPSLRGLVLLGAPSDLEHLAEAVPAIRAAAERGRPVATTLGGKRVEMGPGLLPSLARHDLRAALADLPLPLLVLHAPGDSVVPFVHAERLARWAGPRATLIPLDAADHLLTSPDQAARAAREIVTWALPFAAPR
ncbi:MAG: alpha/beta fold hydrolase [Deferrisomatales bacterium]|nr:alpha/beta fold hydrolase [Deferrisomatales bacterium]